jgi:hypothetical protein
MYLGHKNFGHHHKLGHKLGMAPNMLGHKHFPSKHIAHHHFEPEHKKEKSSDLEKHHQRIRDNIHRY